MNTRRFFVLAAVLLLCCASQLRADDTKQEQQKTKVAQDVKAEEAEALNALSAKLIERWSKIKSLQADLVITSETRSGDHTVPGSSDGKLLYLAEDNKEMYRIEMQTTFISPFDGSETTVSLLTMQDGVHVYNLRGAEGVKMNIDDYAGLPPGRRTIEVLRHKGGLKALPDAKVGDKDAFVFESSPYKFDPQGSVKYRYFFGKRTGLLLRMEGFDKNGVMNHVTDTEYKNLKIDIPLSPNEFIFRASPEVKVKDLTGDVPQGPSS